MHGLGNDFIVIDAMEKEYFPTPNDARRLCNTEPGKDSSLWWRLSEQ